MPKISHSDIKTFKRCRRKWKWRSRLGDYLRPKEVQPQFFLGSAVHHALEMYYGDGDDPVEAIEEYLENRMEELEEEYYRIDKKKRAELEEKADLGIEMIQHYQQWAEKYDDEYWSEVVGTEIEGTVEIPGTSIERACVACDGKGEVVVSIVTADDEVRGEEQNECEACSGEGRIKKEPGQLLYILDGLVKDENGLYWILEHKTASRIRTDHLDMAEQPLKYMWAAQKDLGQRLAGVIYTIIRKKTPKPPKRLKSGGFSRAKSQNTTYAKYKQTLLDEYGEIPEEYEEFLNYLQTEEQKSGNDYIWRKRITRSQEEIQEAGERLKAEYKDMTSNPRIYPNPTRDCEWDCSFQTACKLKSIGADYEAELEKNFVEKGNE